MTQQVGAGVTSGTGPGQEADTTLFARWMEESVKIIYDNSSGGETPTLREMDSESLDRCIQTALSALYPPFKATSPTVLCQVFNVVENCYRGDGFQYLIHFLLPAKQLLVNLQQEACFQYYGFLFRHEGWPLCVHEKVVVQLCPLDQRFVHTGDFYLLVSPPAAPPPPSRAHSASSKSSSTSCPGLLLCSLSAGGHHVEQQEVSKIALHSLFSMAFLDSVNREREQRGAPRLERCLLSSQGDVFRVPWEDLVYPQFISRPLTNLKEDKESLVKNSDGLINIGGDSDATAKLLPASTMSDQSVASSDDEGSEGEYVELTELTELPLPRFSPQKGSLTQSISLQYRAKTSTHTIGQLPKSTDTHTPGQTPKTMDTHTPGQTPKTIGTHTPGRPPKTMDTHTPGHTPKTTDKHTPGHTPKTTDKHTPGHSLVTTHTPKATDSSYTASSLPSCEDVHSCSNLCSGLHKENLNQDSSAPISSASAAPAVTGTFRYQKENQASQHQRSGTDSGWSLQPNSDATNCTEQGEEGDMRVDLEEMERQKEKCEMNVSVDDEEEEQLEDLECIQDEDLLLLTSTSEDQNEEAKVRFKEEERLEEMEKDGLKEDEEDVQIIVLHQSRERRPEEEVKKEDKREGEGEERESEQMDENIDPEDSYSENTTLQILTEDPYSEMKHTHMKNSYCEKRVPIEPEPLSYPESGSKQTQSQDSYSENTTQQTNAEDSYSECTTVHTHTKDSCPDKKNPQTSTEDYNLGSTQQIYSKDNYYGDTSLQTKTVNSHFENDRQRTQNDDCYFENTVKMHTENSNSEKNTLQTSSEDSYFENMQHMCSVDSYCECKQQQTNPEDSYCENYKLQTHTEDSYCENNTLKTHTEDFYCENNTLKTHTEDSYCENNTLKTHTEDSCENKTIQTNTEDSYWENTQQTQRDEANTPAMDPDVLSTTAEESDSGQEVPMKDKEEREEGRFFEETGEGRTEKLQPEGFSSRFPDPGPTEPHQEHSAAPVLPPQVAQSSQSHQSSFYSVLLGSGVVCLPGTKDRTGRALLTVCTWSAVWSSPDCDRAELLHLLLYYISILRKEVRALGLTVIVDARRASPVPALFSAIRSLQETSPGSVHSVFLLVNKDLSLHVDKPADVQVEVLSSLKSLQRHVELHQIPVAFGGSLSFSQSSWLYFRLKVDDLTGQCKNVIRLLQKTINILKTKSLPAATEEAELLLSRYQAVMRSILEDRRLVQLQQEGGASLSRLRSISVTEDEQAAVEAVSAVYNEVDELLHRLVTLSNARTEELRFIVEFRSREQGFAEVRAWLEQVGEERLRCLDEPKDSLDFLMKKQDEFKEFQATANERCRRGQDLLRNLEHWSDISSDDLNDYEVKVHSFRAQLQDFSQRVKTTGQNIERAARLYRFFDQAYGWALEGLRHLAGVSMEDCSLPEKCQDVIGCLEEYHRQHPPIPDSRFQEMKEEAGELRGERGLRQWSFAWSKCQETKKMFDKKMEAAIRTRDSPRSQRSDFALSRSSTSSRKTLSAFWGVHKTSSTSCTPEEDTSSPPRSTSSSSSSLHPITSTPGPASSPLSSQHTPLLQRLFRGTSFSGESPDRGDVCSSSPSLSRLNSSTSLSSRFSASWRQQLRKTQSFDCPATPDASRFGPCHRTVSEPVRRGNTGVFIRGLEVTSAEASDHTLCPRTPAHDWTGSSTRSAGTPETPRSTSSPALEPRPRGSKLRHIMEEMVTTEREYVRSLNYIIRHYFPEMDRADLPQDLRGKRSVVFGNLEKLLDFHSQFFLKELEACSKHPLRVPRCFLRYQEQFSLYALYSKNKPKSDALLANYGTSFFRRKQVELGDKMDLSSYLLKPVQRMSKYALLLTDLMKEVGAAQEAELAALQAATDMVKFQLRHGNDLLAMDAIRDCDVNLKEQGQLIRQDQFIVWTGRRKCQRHVFLFEELVLFSKRKKMEGGLDVFIYKHSFKTADVGLTESKGDEGLRFEIWFRRRTSKNQNFILQAANADVKQSWTADIARILWTQATRNKEMRLKEMVSMGVGNKPFMDIQPSDAAISDRAVHYIMKSRGARTRASIAVSVFDHSNPFIRGMTSDLTTSGPSSSSLLGPLNLHMYSRSLTSSPSADTSITSCIEEDEQEHETSSQPSMTTESSGSSSHCLSGSTGSDSGCVSSHLQEALPDVPGRPSQPSCSSYSSSSSNKQHLNHQYASPTAAPVIGPSTMV